MIHFTGWINVYDCSAYMVFVQFMALFGIMHTQMEPMVKARPGIPLQAAHDGAIVTLVGHVAPSRRHFPTSRDRAPAPAPGHQASAHYIFLA